MATKQVTLTNWESILLIRDKAKIIYMHLETVPDPRHVVMEEVGREIARMGDLFILLKEGIAALPKLQPAQPSAEASRRN